MEHPAEQLDPLNGTTPEPAEGTATAEPTQEEVDQKEKRHLEQLKGREKQVAHYETLLVETAVERVEQDNEYFLELFEKDPTIAEKVAKQFGVTAKEAIDKINAAKGTIKPMEKEPINKEELFKEWEKLQEQKNAIAAANKQFESLEPAQKEVAQKTFESLTAGKNLSAKELSEIAEMTSLYVRRDELQSDAKDKAIASLSSTSLSRGGGDSPSARKEVPGARDLAKALGLEHLYK